MVRLEKKKVSTALVVLTTIVVFFLCSNVATRISARALTSQLQSTVRIDTFGSINQSLTLPYSYIVLVNGAYYEAYNEHGVLVFGGIGDAGSVVGTDASAVINNAVSNLSNGGAILAKNGNYLLTAAITGHGKNNATFQGESRGVILKRNDTTSMNVFELNSVSGWVIKDLTVDGNKGYDTFSWTNEKHSNGIYLTNTTNTKILNCYVFNASLDGIYIDGEQSGECQDILVENCLSTDNDYQGITAYNDGLRVKIVNNDCSFNGDNGILVEGAPGHSQDDFTISGNHCHNNGLTVSLDGIATTDKGGIASTVNTNGGIIRKNYCYDNLYAGIIIHNSETLIATENYCYNNVIKGIIVDGSPNCTVSDSTCDLHEYGIAVAASPNCRINRCTFTRCSVKGISVTLMSPDCIIDKNIIVTAGTAANHALIYISDSSGCIISNNECNGSNGMGLYLDTGSSGALVSGNDFGFCAYHGMQVAPTVSNCTLSLNRVHDNTYDGMTIYGDSNRIDGNYFEKNKRTDIYIRTDARDNSVLNNRMSTYVNEGTGTIYHDNIVNGTLIP